MISLLSSVQTCKVNTGYASKNQSDRFENPNSMLCHVWNGLDSYGRSVCYDSYYTKTPGCSSALDRVVVENIQRPQYMEYINLSANGIDGSIYGNTMPWVEVGANRAQFAYTNNTSDPNNVNNITGNFGKQLSASVYPACGYDPYAQAMAQEQQVKRQQQALQEGYWSNNYRMSSGF